MSIALIADCFVNTNKEGSTQTCRVQDDKVTVTKSDCHLIVVSAGSRDSPLWGQSLGRGDASRHLTRCRCVGWDLRNGGLGGVLTSPGDCGIMLYLQGVTTFMPVVDVRENEPLEKALRRLKKKVEREGILKVVRARKHYEKPSVVRRRKRRESRRRY